MCLRGRQGEREGEREREVWKLKPNIYVHVHEIWKNKHVLICCERDHGVNSVKWWAIGYYSFPELTGSLS